MEILIQLFIAFFKTGLFAVGGGLATLPFIYELCDRTQWFSYQDISNMIAISEATPGAIGINMSTYVGYLVSGVLGGIIATIALVIPSLIIIVFISKGMDKFKTNIYVNCAMKGLKSASFALIFVAFLNVVKLTFFKNGWEISTLLYAFVALLLFICIKKCKFHPVFVLFLAASVGILLQI